MGTGQADSAQILARALVRVATDLNGLLAELAQAGYGEEAAIGRARILHFAPTAADKARVDEYWRELAMERLSTLRAPGNVWHQPLHRSHLLDLLRAGFPPLPLAPGRKLPMIELAHRRCYEEMGDPIHLETVRRVRDASARAIAASGLQDDPDFASMPWRERKRLQRERWTAMLAPHGFAIKNKARNVVVAERHTSDGKFVFAILDESGSNLEHYGQLEHIITVRTTGQPVSHISENDGSLARFQIDTLVPEFRWTARHFSTYPEFCRMVDATTFAALCIYRRLDLALADLQSNPTS
jgi:hypothetical protein